VALAVSQLRSRGLSVEALFIGADWGWYGQDFRALLERLNANEAYLHWPGSVPFDDLDQYYCEADAFVFASSCENLPNIMIEAMGAGLPIASSNRLPMPDVLGNAGIYFDPEDVVSIAAALDRLFQNAELRRELAAAAWQKSRAYSWRHCAFDTLSFISSAVVTQRNRHD
jgi:glycosyltransferase involved in cell wall biosynthesis